MRSWIVAFTFLYLLISAVPVMAQERAVRERIQDFRELRAQRAENKSVVLDNSSQGTVAEVFEGRRVLVYTPTNLPEKNQRAMVMVLHGGMGNASHIRETISLEETADKYGFIVVYPDGTRASKLNEKFKAWNGGGGCCGKPFENNTDDVGYISRLSHFLSQKYGVDDKKIYGMGHSNGAIMIQRVVCEVGVFNKIIPISGPLNIDTKTCAGASGKSILAIHGRADLNVPIEGGYGTRGVTNINFKPLSYAEKIFKTSGADYSLLMLENTDHSLKNIMNTISRVEGITLGEKAARFFGLSHKS